MSVAIGVEITAKKLFLESYLCIVLNLLSAKTFGVTKIRTEICPKNYLYEIYSCSKVCQAKIFFINCEIAA